MTDEQERTRQAVRVKQVHEAELMAKANVLGVGVGLRQTAAGQAEVALVVLVRRKVPAAELAAEDRIPRDIEGVPVDVQEVGDVEARR
jgi:hypothetical protein